MKFNIWNRELVFNEDTKEIKFEDKIFTPSVRTYWDMKELYWKSFIEDDYWLYYMYRDVYFSEDDKKILKNNDIRYDITIIIPKLINWEYNKTYWHYHPLNKNGKRYQELYQVLSWKAIYSQQKSDSVFFTQAQEWDAVNMEESFWHITINPTEDKVLVMANLVDDSFSSEYNEYKENKWWAYYFYNNWWKVNKNYTSVADLKERKELYGSDSKSIYDDFIQTPEKFNYLH